MKKFLGLGFMAALALSLTSCCCDRDPCCDPCPPRPRCCEPRPVVQSHAAHLAEHQDT